MWTKSALSWTIVLFLCLIAFVLVRGSLEVSQLEARIAALETKAEAAAEATIEIHVERAYDADMGVYDYQLCGSSKAATPVKRSRKRMSKLRLDGKEIF